MKRYLITQPKEYGTYRRGDSIFTEINIKEILTNTATDPSSVSLSIYNPNGSALVTDAAMSHSVAGIYDYDYSIPTDACYGVYSIKIETETYDSLSYFNFVVFPWDVTARVRELSGSVQQNDISDYKLSLLAWNAYEETIGDLYELHEYERPGCDPVSGEYLNGSNKRFKTFNYPIADSYGDGEVTGYGETSCGTDISMKYIDSTGATHIGNVTVIDSSIGLIELTDTSGVALPSSTRRVYVNYYSQSPTYNEDLMREAVAYLTAHKVMISFKELGKATLNDLQSNREKEINRFLTRYQDLIEQIGFPMIGSGK